MSQLIGFAAEEQGKEYLCSQELLWVASNYQCKVGEIDLIMRDKEYLVFVEVRTRSSNQHGGGLTSITHSKRKKLIKAALFYLQTKKLLDKQACRFDVLSIDGTPSKITWIKNAFGLDF